MKKSDWGLEIRKVESGFIVKDNEGKEIVFEQRSDEDESESIREMFWHIVDFFNLRPNRYAKTCIAVIIEAGDKYEPGPDEKKIRKYYLVVEKRKGRK